MTDNIKPLITFAPPFDLDDKIFNYIDDEGNGGEPYSYNELIQRSIDISGINEEFLGKKND